MKTLTSQILNRFFTPSPAIGEIMSGIATVGWGATMVHTKPLPSWHSLDYLLSIWNNSTGWGWLYLFFGSGQLISFGLTNNSWHRFWLRFNSAIFLMIIWGNNAVGMMSPTTPWPPWLWLSVVMWSANFYIVVYLPINRNN